MSIQVTLTNYAYKYRSDAPPPLTWRVLNWHLTALRNETVACQLVIQPSETILAVLGDAPLMHWTPTSRLRIALGDWQGPGSAPSTEAYFVGTVPADLGDKIIADPLLHEDSIEVKAHCPQAIWLSICFPAAAPPGRYTLPITLYQAVDLVDEEIAGAASISVDLRALALPDPHEFTHHLDLWQHPSGLARGHGVRLWSEEHWQLIEIYGRELARLGQKAITIIASDAPWAGQRCRRNPEYPSTLHEYNIAHIARGRNGRLRFDFTRLDRYVETYLRLGIDREIGVIGVLAAWDEEFGKPLVDHPDNIRLACHDETTGRITWLRTQDELRQYLAALCAHLKQRGWWSITRFLADEPSDAGLFRQRVDFLKAVAPDARLKVPANRVDIVKPFLNDVNDWIPQLEGIGADVAEFQSARAAVQSRGDRFSWYVCCHPARPNNFITSPSIEARFQGWYTAWAGLDGFLRWAFTCWPADPWHRPAWRFPAWNSGDMFFVYPGRDGRPVRTLRSEVLLMGIQDFELITLARRRAQSDPAVQQALAAAFACIVRGGLADFVNVKDKRPEFLYSLDPDDYEAARGLLIAALSA
jgi:hypothetical protein